MREIRGMFAEGLTLTEDARVIGMVAGKLIVAQGVVAEVAGMVSGDLVVERGARVTVSGMIAGRIDNRGGEIEVTGLVAEGEDIG